MKLPDVPGSAGLEVRLIAARCFDKVFRDARAIDDVVSGTPEAAILEPRDRAFLFALLLTTFRRLGEVDAVLAKQLTKPLPRKAGLASSILRLAIAQLLFLMTPPHAVIDLAVRAAKADRNATHFSGLVNAVLRKIAASGTAVLENIDPARVNTPDWLWTRWTKNYGEASTRSFVAIHAVEPTLDLSVKSDPEGWASRLDAEYLPTGSLRLGNGHGLVPDLSGFASGEWWVQDAAASIPALLLEPLADKSVLDLCAAPGGKTLQLCAAGASVTAVDVSEDRLRRLRENLTRCDFEASVIAADVLEFKPDGLFDAVLLDAPCSATGTIRRHPELPYIKTEAQIGELRSLQSKMLKTASLWVKPGGVLVYCTCSLEREEGEDQILRFLKRNAEFNLLSPPATLLPPEFVSSEGWVRILPHFRLGTALGLDGFFAAALVRQS